MMNEQKAIIFEKIQSALKKGRDEGFIPKVIDPSNLPELPETLIRQNGSKDVQENWLRFEKQIIELGDTVQFFPDVSSLCNWLNQYLTENNLTSGVMDSDAADYLELSPGVFGTSQLELANDRDILFEAIYGITLVDFAIAETGTLGIVSHKGRSRLTSLAPDVHFAVLKQSNIVPDLIDALNLHKKFNIDNSITWITGSSRTADIDGILIQGAHGPKKLFVLVVK